MTFSKMLKPLFIIDLTRDSMDTSASNNDAGSASIIDLITDSDEPVVSSNKLALPEACETLF